VLLEETVRYLPYSGRRYYATQFGEIVQTSTGEVLPLKKRDGIPFVQLDWIDGRAEYDLGLAIYIAFTGTRLADHLWKFIEVLRIDGNPSNCVPANLIYRFKDAPLPVEGRDGFYYVPFHTGYGVNREGVLLNVELGTYLSWTVTKPDPKKKSRGGYRYCRILRDDGRSVVMFRHRAIGFTFLPYGANVGSLVINHLNGDGGDDRIVNLEWTTYSENNHHAYSLGLRPNSARRVLVKDQETGDIRAFETATYAAEWLGLISNDHVMRRLSKVGEVKLLPGNRIVKLDDGEPWPEVDLERDTRYRHGQSCDILARNVFTGEIIAFTGAPAGEKILGIKTAIISKYLRENEVLPAFGYNFRYFSSNVKWPVHPEQCLQVYRERPLVRGFAVILKDEDTGEETFFTSPEKAGMYVGLTHGAINALCANGRLYKRRYRFSCYKLRDEIRSATLAKA
jgi:hypothetical protein